MSLTGATKNKLKTIFDKNFDKQQKCFCNKININITENMKK